MNKDYQYWQDALAGKNPQITTEPEYGFYRKPKKSGGFEPVAIWSAEPEGDFYCMVGGKQTDAYDIWTWVADKPVSEETYRHAIKTGDWPDVLPIIKKQKTDDPLEKITIELNSLIERGKQVRKEGVHDDDTEKQAAELEHSFTRLSKKADEEREKEKAPHRAAAKAVDNKWRDIIEKPKKYSTAVKELIAPYLRKKIDEERKAREEEERKAREETIRLAKEAEEARLAQGNADISDFDAQLKSEQIQEDLKKAQEKADKAAQKAKEDIRISAGLKGNKVGFRRIKFARIIDFDAAMMALKQTEEMQELVERLANQYVRAGKELAGVELEIKEVM